MLVPIDATNVRHPIEIVDGNNAPATGLTYLSSITFAYRRPSDSSWTEVTLAAGGTAHVDGGFRSTGGNVYEFCWPDAAVVSGETTLVRYVYDSQTHYDVIEARLPSLASGKTIQTTLRLVDAATTSNRIPISLVDGNGDGLASKLFSDADLELEVLANDGSAFVAKTLVTATAGTYVSNGWVYLGGHLYEYGLQDGLIVEGGRVFIRVRYDSGDWQYSEVRFLKATQLDMLQSTPGGNTIGGQLDLIGATNTTSTVDIDLFPTGTLTGPLISSFNAGSNEKTYYSGTQWEIIFRPLPVVPGGEQIVFALKSAKTDADADSIIEVEYDVTAETTTITYLNGAVSGSETQSVMVEAENTEDATTRQVTLTIKDTTTAAIPAGTYVRGLKRVGEPSIVFLDDTMTVVQPVTRAFAV